MSLNDPNQRNAIIPSDGINPSTIPTNYNIHIPLDYPPTFSNNRSTPPSYEEAINANTPPPTYESLFTSIKQTKCLEGVTTCLCGIGILFISTVRFIITVTMLIVIPISMIVIGTLHLNDCPQEEYIPVYLLVGGSFSLFIELLTVSARLKEYNTGNITQQSPIIKLLCYFEFIWNIIGSVWVYKEYEPNYDPAFGKYCNKLLYLFTFWLITFGHIICGVILISGFCASIYIYMFRMP